MCLDTPAPLFNCGPCPHCNSFKTERNGYCATYNAERRKADRQALKDASKVKKPIKKVSAKHRKELSDYTVQRRQFLAGNTECQVMVSPECDGDSCEVHHSAKRGANLLNVDTFVATCRPCHIYIETIMSAEQRRERGLLRTVEGTI